MTRELYLEGVPIDHVRSRLSAAGGNEEASGKLASPESSAALAVNAFGWFIPRPELLPAFPGLESAFPAQIVDVEYQARFPWSGGRHPWLDAVVITQSHLIGIESKRFEPFRDKKAVSLSSAYDRPVWGDAMGPYTEMRDKLRSGDVQFQYLDAAQLVKHAFGLVTEAKRKSIQPALVYLYAEPPHRSGRAIRPSAFDEHRGEIASFAAAVAGAEVQFISISYREWLATFQGEAIPHGQRVQEMFEP